MSFLNQLKTQANTLQNQAAVQAQAQAQGVHANAELTEKTCAVVCHYFGELAKQLNILTPPAGSFSVDSKVPWPAMKLMNIRTDARKKMLRDKEVFDYIGMGWQLLPCEGKPVSQVVSVNFPPDLERVQSRLAAGGIQHDRREVRHPEKNSLQAIQFEYKTEARGSVTVTPHHDKATFTVRVVNAGGFGIQNSTWEAGRINTAMLDELAKFIVAQPSRFG